MGASTKRWALAAMLGLAGCCVSTPARVRSTTPLPSRDTVAPQVLLEPPPALQLIREERLAMTARRPSAVARATGTAGEPPSTTDERDPATDTEDVPEAAAEDVPFVEGEVRHIEVRRRRLASPEDLVRAAIRDVESRRPRELYGDRMLLRAAGAVCHCDGDVTELARVQAVMHALVVAARPGLKRCLGEALAADPRVIAKAPMTLVMTQAMLADPVVFRFTPELDVGPEGFTLHHVGWPDTVTSELSTCIEHAIEGVASIDGSKLQATHRVRVPLVGFSQHHYGKGRGLHWLLSLQAAQLGWLHYDRGDVEQALELFEDAYWAYHESEYQYLIGLANERLGHHERAAAAFEVFVDERSYAPEAHELRQRIDALRAAATGDAR